MSVFDTGSELCAPFLARLPVSGVSISVGSATGTQSTIASSDTTAADLDALQFQLGEGPTKDVFLSGTLLLTPNLASNGPRRRWPVFVPLAEELGARALFTFPMLLGAMTVGVISLYEPAPCPAWPEGLERTAAELTASTVRPAVALAASSAREEHRDGEQPSELRREVHQAAGMVMAQLNCTIDEAMARLRAYSFAEGRSLDAVARSVVERTLHFADADD